MNGKSPAKFLDFTHGLLNPLADSLPVLDLRPRPWVQPWIRCHGVTKKGEQCRVRLYPNDDGYCRAHRNQRRA